MGDLDNRFWSKVDVRGPDECWIWLAGATKKDKGYGRFHHEGRTQQAHRLAYQDRHKCVVPAHLFVMHSCDNPLCVNPAHLSPGTHRENVDDAVQKGRMPGGYAPKKTCRRGHLKEGDNLRLHTRPDGLTVRICRQCELHRWGKRWVCNAAALDAAPRSNGEMP